MFTGIVEATGRLVAIIDKGHDITVQIDSHALPMDDVKLGDSIATNGVCLTVTQLTSHGYSADLSSETLDKTAFKHYSIGQAVNLEKAMLPTTRFGGHIVSGHVDGVGQISDIQHVGRAVELWVSIPGSLAKYIAEKGSVTVDGISLTVNGLKENAFKLTIVPHTSQQTTLSSASVGQYVNVEVDVLARYMERLLLAQNEQQAPKESSMSLEFLQKHGFA